MSDVIAKRNALAAQRVIRMLQARHHEAYYASDRAEALKIALSLIPEGGTVGWGGSLSVEQIGLKDAVRAGTTARSTATAPRRRRKRPRWSGRRFSQMPI